MDIRTALAQGTELLSGSRLTAEVLLAHATGRDRSWFYAHPEYELREVEWLHYGRYLHERIGGKPLQYITKKQEFFGRDFCVSPDVLIPRPETELLIEAVLKARPSGGRAVDVGAGSGAIAATLALEWQQSILATDLSVPALAIAQENARRLSAPVTLLQCDLLSAVADASLDIVVSNPPYVPETDRPTLQHEVRDWEPGLALFAGPDGLDVYRRLIPEARRVLRPGGLLALEFGFGQSEAIRALASTFTNLTILPDLAGIPRVLVCEVP